MPENYDDLIVENVKEPETAAPPQERLSDEDYVAKKRMEREDLSDMAKQVETEITGDGGKFQQYLNTLARFERYSAQNTLLIFAQRPDATRLGDFDHWKEQGEYVNKGATGIAIFEPGKEYKREDGSTGVSMNIKKVFDISQTSEKDKTPPAPREIRTLLKALMSNSPAPIKLVDSLQEGNGAHYSESRDVIEVVRGLNGESLFRCLAQEIAYAELDHQNTDTLQCNDKGFAAYAASYALCAKYGIDTKGYSFAETPDYFANCDGKEVRGEIKTIRDTVNDVATRMAKVLEPQKKAPAQEARG
ncbi:MAG: ArdC-like ssDNA-binding domain-containing protein [Eubacteriales bacterium]|nr:ArdC-like ssDNA-binding domain-containing protein [Eubacteriales bacterium]